MMKTKLLVLSLFVFSTLQAQIDYFPPLTGTDWDTLSISELGWCEDQLEDLLTFLEDQNSKAFLILKDGKIVVEEYFGDTDMETVLPWNSAGKTITAMLVGIAQQEGLLSIYDKSSDYLGTGWTSLTPEQEDLITIRHQLNMTTGLDESNFFNTNPSSLLYLAEPGTRWAYHNAPYTLLTNVIENAADSVAINNYLFSSIKIKTGMDGFFIPIPLITSEVFYGTPRGMARFGLLMANQGTWDNTVVLADQGYLNEMITPSQDINESYGYLWWLNGFDSYIAPESQEVFPGAIAPNAPEDLYLAGGKDGQLLGIVPSENLVVVRMGDAPDSGLVPISFNNEMWSYISELICESTPVETIEEFQNLNIFPNPFSDIIHIDSKKPVSNTRIFNTLGQLVLQEKNTNELNTGNLAAGIYWLEIEVDNKTQVSRIVKN